MCRSGLACSAAGLCEPEHGTPAGGTCVVGDECVSGLECLNEACGAAGAGATGTACGSDADCEAGLRCAVEAVTPTCEVEGTADLGEPCVANADCYQGLVCDGGWCSQTGASAWSGVHCAPPTTGEVKAYFEFPGAEGADLDDFFRLPFPNDARRHGGKLDLTGFPTPGTFPTGVDPVQLYVDAITATDSSWGTYETVTFRFSGAVDVQQADLGWVDVTPGASELGQDVGLTFLYDPAASAYVCDNALFVRRPQGAPLLPGHVYAVWVKTSVTSTAGVVGRSPIFDEVMSMATPADGALGPVHDAFAPFRDYLATKGIDPETVLDATVITVGDTRASMAFLAAAVAALPPPTAKSWVKCGGGAVSPCPQNQGDRACGPGDPTYDEYDALVSLPIFQRGTAPYESPSDGGDIDPMQTLREDVCMAITVPRSPMPAAGWPLVIFAHGTGGSYRDHVTAAIAGALATGAVPSAVLGIDQVEHGPRRGDSTASPDDLFYNFLNPLSARGNPLQGAADQLSLARFAATLNLTAQESQGSAFQTDPGAIVFFGHSQGSTEGSLMLPYGDAINGAVLSGNGAGLIDALLHKTNPDDIAAYVPTLVQDPEFAALGEYHPVLSLLQEWIDPADPLNFAAAVARSPLPGHLPKHAFQTYGLGDTYAPPITLANYALAGGLTEVTPDPSVTTPDAIGTLVPVAAPLRGNVMATLASGDALFTLGVREYAPPAGTDGHFVVLDVPSANADAVRFLGMAASKQVPQIGAGP